MPKYREHAEHILGTYLQYADHSQCTQTATLPIGVNDGGKEKKRKKAVPRAAAAYGRQLKMPFLYSVLGYKQISRSKVSNIKRLHK